MKGFRVIRNYPFCGVLGPGRFYWKQPTVLALMIEVNRSLYMNEISGERLPEFLDFKNILLSVAKRPHCLYTRKKLSAFIDSF